MDVTELHDRCSAEFGTRVHAVGGRWDHDTPAPGWDVRHLVHAVDLARAVGEDERWDTATTDAVLAWLEPRERTYREFGVTGPRVEWPVGAGPQSRLLGMMGRSR